jgi:hypothetical protein
MAKQRRYDALVPPGVSLITRILATKVIPIIGAGYIITTALERAVDVSFPKYITWSALIAAVPLVVFVRACTYEWKKRSRAKALGASLAPVSNGKWLGNYDVLLHLLENVKNGYIGVCRQYPDCPVVLLTQSWTS